MTKAKEWIKSFWTLGDECAGYKPHNVTPYMHIMAYHVPNFIRQYGSIKQFSCQGKISEVLTKDISDMYAKLRC